MSNRKGIQICTLLLVLFLALSTIACQNTANTTATAAGTTTAGSNSQQTTTTAAKQEPVTFKLLMGSWKTWDEPMTADPLGKWLIEKTGVTIDVELIPGDTAEKFALVLATKEYPDFIVWPGDSLAEQFIAQEAFVAYDEHFEQLPNHF